MLFPTTMIIFPTTPENSQFFETVLNKTYLRLRTKTGIDFVTDHMYRHSFATRLVENSVDYKALSSLMGHTDVSFALRRYATTEYDFLRQQINLLHKT